LWPVGNFTPPPRLTFQERCDEGESSETRANVVMSPRPRAFSFARVAGPPARGDGMPHDASMNGTPALRLTRGVT
jgi:hypothetical protein